MAIEHKAALQRDAAQAKQSLTDYLQQAIEGTLDGSYAEVTTRFPLMGGHERVKVELTLPLSLLTKIEEITKAYGITFTDFVLGAWIRRLEAEGTA